MIELIPTLTDEETMVLYRAIRSERQKRWPKIVSEAKENMETRRLDSFRDALIGETFRSIAKRHRVTPSVIQQDFWRTLRRLWWTDKKNGGRLTEELGMDWETRHSYRLHFFRRHKDILLRVLDSTKQIKGE